MKAMLRLLTRIGLIWTTTGTLFSQWVQTSEPSHPVNCLAVSGTNLLAGTRRGVFLSTNNGTSWQAINNGLGDSAVYSLAVSGSNIVAGTSQDTSYSVSYPKWYGPHGRGMICRSTNSGASWQSADTSAYTIVSCFAISGSNIFAGATGAGSGVSLSTNNGTSWAAINNGLKNFGVNSLAVSGANLLAGTDGGIYLSTNNGTNWQTADSGFPGGGRVHALVTSDTNRFAGTDFGVYRSTNNGTSWSLVDAGMPDYVHNSGWITALAINPNGTGSTNLFAGTAFDGVFLSTNNGTSWTSVNAGLTNDTVVALAVSATSLFAGTSNGVWRRPLSEMITSVDRVTDEIPHEFLLDQNYPNPFNPSTSIRYSLQDRSDVTLIVFNVLGQQVAELVNSEMEAGYHEVRFDASHLASGVYFYRLTAGRFVELKKLLLLR